MRRKRRARHPNASGDRAPDACLPNPAKNQPNSESAIANHVALIISDCGRAPFYECHSEFKPTALTQAFAQLPLPLGRDGDLDVKYRHSVADVRAQIQSLPTYSSKPLPFI